MEFVVLRSRMCGQNMLVGWLVGVLVCWCVGVLVGRV